MEFSQAAVSAGIWTLLSASCLVPLSQSGPPSGPGVLWQSPGPGQGQRQWASTWGPRILAPLPGALRARQVDMGGDGGSGERKTLELRFTAQPMHLAPGEHLEAEPRAGGGVCKSCRAMHQEECGDSAWRRTCTLPGRPPH